MPRGRQGTQLRFWSPLACPELRRSPGDGLLASQQGMGARWALPRGPEHHPADLLQTEAGHISIPRMVAAKSPGRVEEGVGGRR